MNKPPTSVIIQSGIAKLTIANISAAINNVPEIIVSLSILDGTTPPVENKGLSQCFILGYVFSFQSNI